MSRVKCKQFRELKSKLLGLDTKERKFYSDELRKSWNENDTLQFLRQTRVLARTVIDELRGMTDLSQKPLELPKIQYKMAKLDRRLLTDPADPAMAVAKIATYRYSPHETQEVSEWVHRLLGSHSKLSAESYNFLIGYALYYRDIGLAMHILETMRSQNAAPDRTSLHLFLDFNAHLVAKDPYPRPALGHPLVNTRLLLKQFGAWGVSADQFTWNLVMQCMPLGFGKSFLIEEMEKLDVPLNDSSKRVIFDTLMSDERGVDTDRLVESLDAADPAVFRLVVDNFLTRKSPNNENVLNGWRLLVGAPQKDTSPEMMHIFLKRFAHRRHLDWAFGILEFFGPTPWDSQTWELFIEAASFIRENDGKPVVLGTILKQAEREDVPLTSRSRVLARRAHKRYNLQDLGEAGWQELCRGLAWKSAMQPRRPELLKTIGFSDDGVVLPSQEARLSVERFKGMPRTDTRYRRAELANDLRKLNEHSYNVYV